MEKITTRAAFGLFIAAIIIMIMLPPFYLQAATFPFSYLENVRYSSSKDCTRVVFDLSAATRFQDHLSDDQQSVFIMLEDCKDRGLKKTMMLNKSPLVKQVQINTHEKPRSSLIVQISLRQMADYKIFTLKPDLGKPHRIVMDFFEPKQSPKTMPKTAEAGPKLDETEKNRSQGEKEIKEEPRAESKRPPGSSEQAENTRQKDGHKKTGGKKVIVIDPGHGGEDPGAISSSGTREKDIVLQLAREIKSYLNQNFPDIQVYLTRDGDYFIPLRKRILIAHQHQADLFISLHTNASRKPEVQGASVFYLSETGASDRASRLLAARENSSDLIAGVKFSKDKEVNTILIDLVQTYTTSESIRICQTALDSLEASGFHNKGVKCANFAVLKSPSIPSALLEIGYITNSQDEKKLTSRTDQQQIARQIARSAIDYLLGKEQEEPPPAPSQMPGMSSQMNIDSRAKAEIKATTGSGKIQRE